MTRGAGAANVSAAVCSASSRRSAPRHWCPRGSSPLPLGHTQDALNALDLLRVANHVPGVHDMEVEHLVLELVLKAGALDGGNEVRRELVVIGIAAQVALERVVELDHVRVVAREAGSGVGREPTRCHRVELVDDEARRGATELVALRVQNDVDQQLVKLLDAAAFAGLEVVVHVRLANALVASSSVLGAWLLGQRYQHRDDELERATREGDSGTDFNDDYAPQANALVGCAAVTAGAVAADTAAAAVDR